MSKIQLSIQTKAYLFLVTLMLIMLGVVIVSSIDSERTLGYEMIKDRLQENASNYLDTMNILMLSGAMHNREMIRTKLLANNNMLEAKSIRSEQINKMYGKGLEHSKPSDELDKRALKGEEIWLEEQTEQSHTLTYLMPVIARKDYRGTNCLGCHQAKDGDVLGAIRLTYSLDSINTDIKNNAMSLVVIQVILVTIIVLILSFLLRRFIFKPIRHVQKTLTKIEKTSDLSLEMDARNKDEIGKMSYAFNHMLSEFSDSLSQVVTSTKELDTSANRLQSQSSDSENAAMHQKQEVQAIEAIITELKNNLETVKANAVESTKASQESTRIADDGRDKIESATSTMVEVNKAVDDSAKIISNLAERSKEMAQVLVVINEIAEQTNLLALNAAIEAARAGEAGRGFAVVADEVRSLSKRTHDSTQEIASMIKQLQEESSHCVSVMSQTNKTADVGVEKINETASSLIEIQQQVAQIFELNSKTFEHIEEQNNLTEKVCESVSQIADQSNNTANSAKETVNTSRNLTQLAQQLTSLVSRFKLKGHS